jgi:hypothetical protein
MADTPAHQPHGPSDNANKTAAALRDVPLVIRHRIQPPPSRNEVVVGPDDSFHSCDRASKQIQQNASPHQHRSTPKNANKTTDALRDEGASKGGQIQPPPPPIKEAVVVPNLPACPHNNNTSSTTCPASDNGNGAANEQQNNVSFF